MKTPRPRRRINYVGVLIVSLLCLLLIFASHRFTASTADYDATAPTGGGGGGARTYYAYDPEQQQQQQRRHEESLVGDQRARDYRQHVNSAQHQHRVGGLEKDFKKISKNKVGLCYLCLFN